ncbi:MAG: hypothetical protein ACKOQ7_07765 [Actinomycetota bacterium]
MNSIRLPFATRRDASGAEEPDARILLNRSAADPGTYPPDPSDMRPPE